MLELVVPANAGTHTLRDREAEGLDRLRQQLVAKNHRWL